MDDCRMFEEQISASLDGELTAREEETLREHLRTCESCRAYARTLRAVSETLRADAPPVPPELGENIMAALRAAAPPKKIVSILPFPRRTAGLAAAAAIVLLAGFGGARLLTPKGATFSAEATAARDSLRYSAQEAAAAGTEQKAAEPEEAVPEAPAESAEAETYNTMLFSADAGREEFLLRSAGGEEWPVEDVAVLGDLGETTQAPAPEREPDFTLTDMDGAVCWLLWQEGEDVLLRKTGDTAVYTARIAELWDALGIGA